MLISSSWIIIIIIIFIFYGFWLHLYSTAPPIKRWLNKSRNFCYVGTVFDLKFTDQVLLGKIIRLSVLPNHWIACISHYLIFSHFIPSCLLPCMLLGHLIINFLHSHWLQAHWASYIKMKELIPVSCLLRIELPILPYESEA